MSRCPLRIVFLFVTLSTVACSSTNSTGEINYRTSEVTPTLEAPPDLIGTSTGRNLDIPGSVVGKEENIGRFTETGYIGLERKVLPVFANMSIQGQGDLYWLAVSMPAEELYPLIREYWAEQGFLLTVDEPSIGVMETEWLGLKSGSDSFISSFIASMQGAESKDQYLTRLERSEDNNSTRVYLAHRGQELIISD
ncbi:MAG: outer membrane protein assembly factor BamC, partial [bacterium]|nr:outer membrane protein assembly factor BamC [bacterium]